MSSLLMYHGQDCLLMMVCFFWGRIDGGLNLGQDCMYSVCGVDLQVLVIAR